MAGVTRQVSSMERRDSYQRTGPSGATRLRLVAVSLCFLMLARVTGSRADSTLLVKDGKSKCVVVLVEDAAPTERHASAELRHYLHEVSGAEVPEVTQLSLAPPSSLPIILGTPLSSSEIKDSGLLPQIDALSDEGFLLHSDKQRLIIAAKKPMGVLYGVYAFLEKYVGVRWFFPGKEGEYCPHNATLTLEKIHDVENPAFAVRILNLTCTNVGARLIDTWDWMVRNRMQLRTPPHPWSECRKELEERGAIIEGGGHCLAYLLPQDKYFQAHPEYYPLINGKRTPCFPKEGGVYQLCTSNPEVIDIAARGIIAFFNSRPEAKVYAIGNNDGDGWCECDACRALDDPWERKQGFVGTRFYRFVNAVAERVIKECPDKAVEGWGYQIYRTAPRGIKPDPRLALMVAMHGRCYRHSYDDASCPVNANLVKVMDEWLAFGNMAGPYEYYSCFINDLTAPPYVPVENIVSGDVKTLWRLGCRFWRAEVPPPDGVFGKTWDNPFTKENWRSQLLTYYLAAKLLWNPQLDAEKLQQDFYAKYYGPASAPMQAYRRLLAKSWQSIEGHFIYGNSPVSIGKGLMQPGREEELLKDLILAEQAAAGHPEILTRIEKERELFNAVWHRAYIDLQKSTTWDDVKVTRRKEPIKIDGVLDEADWSNANTVTGFYNLSAKSLAAAQTFVKMLYDDDYLYLGVTCMEPSVATMKARYTQRDEEVWRDDDVELFIDPDSSGKRYFHLAINPKGTIYDTQCELGGLMDRSFNADCEVACKTLTDRWVVEMKIKVSSLKATLAEGRSWKVDVGRNRPGQEASTWTDGSFHQPASFRTIVFGGDPLVRNGGFEKVVEITTDAEKRFRGWHKGWSSGNDPILFPLDWSLHDNYTGKLTIVRDDVHSGKRACKIEKGWIASYFPASTGDNLHIEFWAKGENAVTLMLFQYAKTPEGNTRFLSTDTIAAVQMTPEWKRYSYDHTISLQGVVRVALAFGVGGTMVLDDVCDAMNATRAIIYTV